MIPGEGKARTHLPAIPQEIPEASLCREGPTWRLMNWLLDPIWPQHKQNTAWEGKGTEEIIGRILGRNVSE